MVTSPGSASRQSIVRGKEGIPPCFLALAVVAPRPVPPLCFGLGDVRARRLPVVWFGVQPTVVGVGIGVDGQAADARLDDTKRSRHDADSQSTT